MWYAYLAEPSPGAVAMSHVRPIRQYRWRAPAALYVADVCFNRIGTISGSMGD